MRCTILSDLLAAAVPVEAQVGGDWPITDICDRTWTQMVCAAAFPPGADHKLAGSAAETFVRRRNSRRTLSSGNDSN